MRLESALHVAQSCGLLRRDLGRRDSRPDFDYLCEQLLIDLRSRLAQQLVQLRLHLKNTRAAGRDFRVGFLVLAACGGLRQVVKLRLKALKLGLKLGNLRQLRRVQIEA